LHKRFDTTRQLRAFKASVPADGEQHHRRIRHVGLDLSS
jgi:hypothetical protein